MDVSSATCTISYRRHSGCPTTATSSIPRPPDWTPSWDALSDDIGGTELPARAVLLWHGADRFAARHPKIFAEACVVLTDLFKAASAQHKQLVLVLAGDGADFKSPDTDGGKRQ
jgi:hypothetical protein